MEVTYELNRRQYKTIVKNLCGDLMKKSNSTLNTGRNNPLLFSTIQDTILKAIAHEKLSTNMTGAKWKNQALPMKRVKIKDQKSLVVPLSGKKTRSASENLTKSACKKLAERQAMPSPN
jgi:hypothetical protein